MQLQRLDAGKLGSPVGQVVCARGLIQTLTLPHRVVGELPRQGLERVGLTGAKGAIQRAQFARQDAHGPAVGHDVVHHQQQRVLVLTEVPQAHTQQRRTRQVERLGGHTLQHLGERTFALRARAALERNRTQLQVAGDIIERAHRLHRHPVARQERRAQTFVPLYQRMHRAFERPEVQRPEKAQRLGDVVDAAGPCHPVEKPQAFLGARQRGDGHAGVCLRGAILRGLNRIANGPGLQADVLDINRSRPRLRYRQSGMFLRDGCAQAGHRGRFEQRSHTHLDVQRRLNSRGHPHGQQRVAAQIEEVVVDADRFKVQHAAPDLSEDCFQRIARRDEAVATAEPHGRGHLHGHVRRRQLRQFPSEGCAQLASQFSNGRRLEQHAHRQLDAPHIAQPRDESDGQQRVPPQIKKTVVDANDRVRQDFAPDLDQGLLKRAERVHLARSVSGWHRLAAGRCGQRLAVHLAAGGKRQGGQWHEGRRNHVLGQLLLEHGAQFGRGRHLERRHHIGHQTRIAGGVFSQQHHGFAQLRLVHQHGFDLAELDAKSPQLDLVVDAPEEVDVAVGQVARQVARAVQARTGIGAERVGHEALGRQFRTVEVAATDLHAADVELSRHTDRDRLAAGVQDVCAGVGQRSPDRHTTVLAARLTRPEGGVHGRFRGPVVVVEFQSRKACKKALQQI